MDFNNTIAIISNDAKTVEQIRSKLVLLRDIDSIEHINTVDYEDYIEEKNLSLIILHTEQDNENRLNILRNLKENGVSENIPIILLEKNCTEDYLMETFDLGIREIIHMPCRDWEILTRTVWSLQEYEVKAKIKTKDTFLSNLGIVQKDTGFYTSKYCEEFLNHETLNILNSKKEASIMLLKGLEKERPENGRGLGHFIKSCIRYQDDVGIDSRGRYYLFLPGTKLRGVYSLFERIKKVCREYWIISASVIEISDKSFDKIKPLLEDGLNKATEKRSLIIASETNKLNAGKTLNVFKKSDIAVKEKIKEIDSAAQPIQQPTVKEEDYPLYKQMFKNKVGLIVKPIFERFKKQIERSYEYVYVEYDTGINSHFKAVKDTFEIALTIEYEKNNKIRLNTVYFSNSKTEEISNSEVDLVNFNYSYMQEFMEKILKNLNSK